MDRVFYRHSTGRSTGGKRAFSGDWRVAEVRRPSLRALRRPDISLTESCAMSPGAAVTGLYFSHPDSRCFGVAEIGRDQSSDYAERKCVTLEETEKWVAQTWPTTSNSKSKRFNRRIEAPRKTPRRFDVAAGLSRAFSAHGARLPRTRLGPRRQGLRSSSRPWLGRSSSPEPAPAG
jgi:hypothetical protein